MGNNELRIVNIAPPLETECKPLGAALQIAEAHGSMHLSPAAALVIKEYISSPDDINVPVGNQTIQVERPSPVVPQDKGLYWKTIERPAVGKCPPAKCGNCILNVIPMDAEMNGYKIQRELIDSAKLDLHDTFVQLSRYL